MSAKTIGSLLLEAIARALSALSGWQLLVAVALVAAGLALWTYVL